MGFYIPVAHEDHGTPNGHGMDGLPYPPFQEGDSITPLMGFA